MGYPYFDTLHTVLFLQFIQVARSQQVHLFLRQYPDTVFHIVGTDNDIGSLPVGKGVHIFDEHAFIRQATEHLCQ